MASDKPSSTSTAPEDVIIVGGSLSSLMHGIALHQLGRSVHILEQFPTDTPPSHMAGVCLGPDVLRFLERFDRAAHIPLGIPSELLQSLDAQGVAHPFLRAGRVMSSWDALYFRLRANFDGLVSEYVPLPPGPKPLEGESAPLAKERARYEVGQRVVGIEEADGRVRVTVQDQTGAERSLTADLVLGADGPNSMVRGLFVTGAERRYAGYVAWRGTVLEEEVSAETRQIFSKNITYSILQNGHVIVYNIPGPAGTVEPGKRLLNFCWYTNTEATDLDALLTGTDGVRHHTSLAPGNVRPEVWANRRKVAHTIFSAPYLEVLDRIHSPFLHIITDYCSPRTAFLGGKVLLVGDASALPRPHIAFSTNQAAYQALLTEKLVQGGLTLNQWEYQVTTATYLHWKRSIWFGEYFQRPLYVSLGSAVQYWAVAALNKLRYWAGWLPEQAV